LTKLVVTSATIPFDPSPEIASALLAALTDPSLSLNQLASALRTTPEALSAWMTRPDIRERIESVDRSTTWRTRLIASAHLYAVPGALTKILQDFTNAQAAQKGALSASSGATHENNTPTSAFRTALLEARRAETTRKSAAILISLSRQRPAAGPDLAASPPAAQSTSESPAKPHRIRDTENDADLIAAAMSLIPTAVESPEPPAPRASPELEPQDANDNPPEHPRPREDEPSAHSEDPAPSPRTTARNHTSNSSPGIHETADLMPVGTNEHWP
jgi:hypothetical protein